MAEPARTSQPPSWIGILGLVAAVPLYFVTLASIHDLMIEPTNVGSSALGGISEFLMWLALLAFVYATGARATSTPLIHAVRAWVALGGAAASLFALSGPDNAIWVWTTPLLMPPLAVLFALWSTWRRGDPAKIRHRVAIGFAAIALPLVAAPFVQTATWDEAAFQAKMDRRDAKRVASNIAVVDAIDPRQGLAPFVDYLNLGEDDLAIAGRQRALARIPTVPSRQADTVRLLGRGRIRDLADLWRFDLAATDELCGKYRLALDWSIVRAGEEPDSSNLAVVMRFMPQERNIQWLAGEGCDLSAPLTRLAQAGRALEPRFGSEREFAARLEALLRPQAPPAR